MNNNIIIIIHWGSAVTEIKNKLDIMIHTASYISSLF
jgi:hypothetical protein